MIAFGAPVTLSRDIHTGSINDLVATAEIRERDRVRVGRDIRHVAHQRVRVAGDLVGDHAVEARLPQVSAIGGLQDADLGQCAAIHRVARVIGRR